MLQDFRYEVHNLFLFFSRQPNSRYLSFENCYNFFYAWNMSYSNNVNSLYLIVFSRFRCVCILVYCKIYILIFIHYNGRKSLELNIKVGLSKVPATSFRTII